MSIEEAAEQLRKFGLQAAISKNRDYIRGGDYIEHNDELGTLLNGNVFNICSERGVWIAHFGSGGVIQVSHRLDHVINSVYHTSNLIQRQPDNTINLPNALWALQAHGLFAVVDSDNTLTIYSSSNTTALDVFEFMLDRFEDPARHVEMTLTLENNRWYINDLRESESNTKAKSFNTLAEAIAFIRGIHEAG